MDSYDVVVVGAGLAGLQCTRLMSQRGLRVLLIDRKQSLTQSIHTTGIFVRRTLEDFSLPEDCLGPPIRDVTLYSPARSTLHLSSPYPEFRIGKMGRLYERYLIQCEMAGAQWMPGTRFGGYSRVKQNRLVVRLDNQTRSQSVMTRFLIGADGANSRVARSLSLDLNREWIVGVEDVLTGVPLNDSSPRLHCFLDPLIAPGYLAWVVNDGEETHVGTAGYAEAFNPVLALEKFKANINSVVDLGFARVLERRSGRIPVGGVLPHICSSDGLLAGDAAGAVSPLTAGGLDPCLRLSTLAARVVVEYLQTQDPDVLREYSGNLFRARFTSRLWMRRAISTFRNRNLLEVGFAGLRLPLARSFAWHVFFGRGSFPDVGQETEGSLALCE